MIEPSDGRRTDNLCAPLAGLGDRLGRGLHGEPRFVHRQHRLPRSRARLRRHQPLRPLLGVERLRDRVRRATGARGAHLGSRRPQAWLPDRPRALHGRLGFVRCLAIRARAGRSARAPGRRRGFPRPDIARTAAARVSACAACHRRGCVGGGRRRSRGGRPARRWVACRAELALGLRRECPGGPCHLRDRGAGPA